MKITEGLVKVTHICCLSIVLYYAYNDTKLSFNNTVEEGEHKWLVQGTRCSYMVVSNQINCTSCSQESNVCVATECKFLCLHMYSCDDACYDFKNGHICPHIHPVHSLAIQEDSSLQIPKEHSNSKEQTVEECSSGPSICLPPSPETTNVQCGLRSN